jgi:S1-C subfamily serine protease
VAKGGCGIVSAWHEVRSKMKTRRATRHEGRPEMFERMRRAHAVTRIRRHLAGWRPYLPVALGVLMLIASQSFWGIASAQVASTVLQRVRKIGVGPLSATAFTIEVDHRQYIVTTKHVVASLKGPEEAVTFCEHSATCQAIPVTVLRCDDPIDIAVLVPRTQQTAAVPFEPDSKGALLGQDMYFLGFPYADNSLATTTGDLTVAFIRKGTFAALHRRNDATVIYLDGRINPGFSGGPIVYRDLNRAGSEFKVAGVMSGLRSEVAPVFRPEPIDPSNIKAEDRANGLIVVAKDGRHFKLMPSGEVVRSSSDIVFGYAIDHAVDLIRKSQAKGPLVSE